MRRLSVPETMQKLDKWPQITTERVALLPLPPNYRLAKVLSLILITIYSVIVTSLFSLEVVNYDLNNYTPINLIVLLITLSWQLIGVYGVINASFSIIMVYSFLNVILSLFNCLNQVVMSLIVLLIAPQTVVTVWFANIVKSQAHYKSPIAIIESVC